MLKKYLTKSNNFMKQINLYWLIGSFFSMMVKSTKQWRKKHTHNNRNKKLSHINFYENFLLMLLYFYYTAASSFE